MFLFFLLSFSHQSKKQTENNIGKTKEIADYLNASKKKSESKAKLTEIQQNLITKEVCFISYLILLFYYIIFIYFILYFNFILFQKKKKQNSGYLC
jgi:hypothetical protein